MKYLISIILTFTTASVFSCGYGIWDGMSFYNLFDQTSISAPAFYPFLKDEANPFYRDDEINHYQLEEYPQGNILLWKQILTNWNTKEIGEAVYKFDSFDWSDKTDKIEQKTKNYLDFAQKCSDVFRYRNKKHSWDYNEITAHKTIDSKTLLSKANKLLKEETNKQLKLRYYYQIIRIFHYTKAWEDAIRFYENKIENKFAENEIYYYITDQVAGCYYSTKNYEKAAYLFTKVFNKSYDRKKSAFMSYHFCARKDAEGKPFFNSKNDQKDYLLIKSLQNFSDQISNIDKFIKLDANDERIELLFMRALNNVERKIWPRNIGVSKKTLPSLDNSRNYKKLLSIAERQTKDPSVNNKDFWKLSASYLSFINGKIKEATRKLNNVDNFEKQKQILATVYKVFSWKTMTRQNENFIAGLLEEHKLKNFNFMSTYKTKYDWLNLIMDKISHTYYTNNQLSKAFLTHNELEDIKNMHSVELLGSLESLYKKEDKNDFEKILINKKNHTNNFMDYVSYHKGIYYLYQQKPKQALYYFKLNKSHTGKPIAGAIFSNNIKECFNCDADEVMKDEVYKASVFSFIESSFSRKELAKNLLELQKIIREGVKWKVKCANYLLGNYYFNISNTGYYRGFLEGYPNRSSYNYIKESYHKFNKTEDDTEIIANRHGYNLSTINGYGKKYHELSNKSMQHYQNVIDLSTDRELNARCLYMMAKCELNDFYNNGTKETFEIKINKYSTLKLPKYKSFKILKEKYQDTKFHKMIISECSYFEHYSAIH